MKQKILRALPYIAIILVMVLIFSFSAQTKEESSDLSIGVTKRIVDFIFRTASEAQKQGYLKQLHNIIRKCAHFVLYAMLGYCAASVFTEKKKTWLCAVALCFIYAVSDEVHQMFVDGRGAMVKDVFIDTCGGGFGAAMFLLILTIYRLRKDRKR